MNLAAFPQDVFLLILQYLEAWDLLRCQLVCREWKQTFSHDIYLKTMLKGYAGATELRRLLAKEKNCLNLDSQIEINLQSIFRTVASRYFHLSLGKARSLERYKLRALDQSGDWYPVGQWDYHESQPSGRLYHESAAAHLRGLGWKPYLFLPTLWSYDNGFVVFAPSLDTSKSPSDCLNVVDLESGGSCRVPFDMTGKVLRGLRLREGTLIVEWAEKNSYHDLNLVDKVHRHFATCYDVHRQAGKQIEVEFRSEWKIHFLGLPLSTRDYFFSTHTRKHYALYLWQPNRSLWTGDEDQPIEALFIWDIEAPSQYLPSRDPSNSRRGQYEDKGPHMVARFSFRELEFLGVRQQANITLTSLHVDSATMSMTFQENTFESGQGYFDPAERRWCSTTTTFPFVGQGPCLQRRPDVELPAYRGHCTMDSTDIEEIERWFLPIMDVSDQEAQVRFSLIETCFTGMMIENKIMLRIKALDRWTNLDDEIVREVGAMGRIAGDERWVVGQNARLELVVAKFQ
ncbi:hypothetical protein H2198_008862 [Neophaeococcomyces mojaviensis]|uniref:Uncharacterized protein n=1 Tax=Neophaeococcomyces mojaviensis TaxID=3383035 RepID=A0ACC2ZWB5_9EURO|nr:hypothetical protein H2198_008862 [Knufia sp. JES_112]